ncbi:unnamed protein product [Urochloa decumbens]|uniref:BTB domain-containing protein n=1 Tax=Urochloa decumbens TaxID=240449 RepID=A0ABC9DNQ9_9POAL
MKEARLQRVEIKDMDAAVFRAMLRFIYTDMVPELDRPEDGVVMAQHLLAAADLYGLDSLKSMCEDKLCDGTNVETAATALGLAEHHGCSKRKARCLELIAANLDAVMDTEGYKHLMTSSPLVMNDKLPRRPPHAIGRAPTRQQTAQSAAPASSSGKKYFNPWGCPLRTSPTPHAPFTCSRSTATRPPLRRRTPSRPSDWPWVGSIGRSATPRATTATGYDSIAFKLVLLGAARRGNVKASLRCQLLYASSNSNARFATGYFVKGQTSHAFKRIGESSEWVPLCRKIDLEAPGRGIIADDSFTVECTITVVAEQVPAGTAMATALVPPYTGSQSLNHDLGELLGKGTGSDVTLAVAGESFAAHKAILASRSPVFMAEFFGTMKESHSELVEIKDMEATVFGAMLGFIYTDMVPELDRPEDGVVMAQHLLAAADRYGIGRLKSMCEDKLCDGTDMETAAMTLALAEQHGCSKLKAQCVELIAANLDAVMETQGYKNLMISFPLVMNDLLRAMRGRKN